MSGPSLVRRLGRRARRGLFLPRFHPRVGLDRSRNGFITCTGKHDRAGAQALAVLSTMVFAERAGLRYIHTPFQRMDGTDRKDIDRWEALFNLGHDEMQASEVLELGHDTVALPSPAYLPFKRGQALYVVRHAHEYANRFPDEYERMSERLRRKYAAGSKEGLVSHYTPGRLNVAVHVRRGDVTRHTPDRKYTDNSHVASAVRDVRDTCATLGLSPVVRLYSEGSEEEFTDLKSTGVSIHAQECPFSTFNNLVEADILIMSKSTFSYVAALISRKIAIYESFHTTSFNHRPLSRWLRIDGRGRVNADALVSALTRWSALASERG